MPYPVGPWYVCLFRLLRKRKRIRTATQATANKPASIPPTIAPVLDFFSVAPSTGDAVPVVVEDDELDDEDAVALKVGWTDSETGDCALRQVASDDAPTTLISEEPPLRPCASVIMNTIPVPALTSAIQSKDTGPFGGFKMKDSPPGTTPCTSVQIILLNSW